MMTPSAAIVAAFCLAYAGLGGLCLAMGRHQRQVLGRELGRWPARALRLAGWCALTVAMVACVQGWGVSVGVVAWFGFLSAAGLALVFVLPYLPRAGLGLATPALLLGLWLSS